MCQMEIKRYINKVQQTALASESKHVFKIHFFLSPHTVKTSAHATDRPLVWNVLKDYGHLPRKEYTMITRTCPIFIFKILGKLYTPDTQAGHLTKPQINLNLSEIHSRLIEVGHNKMFLLLFCLIIGFLAKLEEKIYVYKITTFFI